MSSSNNTDKESKAEVWRSLPADLTDEEWELIKDLVPTYSGGGAMGRPAKETSGRKTFGLVDHRCLRIDHERDPTVTAGFVWAAHARTLLRRLTRTPQQPTTSTQ